MKHRILILAAAFALICAAGLFAGCANNGGHAPKGKIEGSPLYVKKVENLPDDFIMGVDLSSVIAEEESGVKYYGFEGAEQDVFRTLAESGVTHIRVRVWNDPFDAEGRGFGGGNNDVQRACVIGERAAKYGLKLIVDFHYSDFWADPGKQMVPRAWADMDLETKAAALYEFTVDSLNKISASCEVAMVSMGNETNGAMCGEKSWFGVASLMIQSSKAIRETCPDALIAVHFANPERAGAYKDYAWRLDYYKIDYDVFASSYYPYWHGTLDNLAAVLNEVSDAYGKKVMVMETSYAFTAEDTDFSGNTISDGGGIVKNYPFTVQGQANSLRDVIDTVANGCRQGVGVVYWEGAWITVGRESWEKNSAIWEKYGSGWASSFAGVYDPDDAGKWYGGSAVDNQALFDADGRPLESLRVFNLVRYGNETAIVPDAVEDVELTVDLAGRIELPAEVNAVMTDDSRQPVPVEWEITDADYGKMYSSGPARYDIKGVAGGLEAHCFVNMIEFNFLQNPSFEDGELGAWEVTDLAKADELYVEDKKTDSLSGQYHMHFWSAAQGSVEFTLEQKVADLPSGKYKFAISIMGGDAGDSEIYAYVKIDGEIVARCPMKITSYGNWDTGSVTGVEYTEGREIAVGVYVKCAGEGAGAWGKIDDAMLNSDKE